MNKITKYNIYLFSTGLLINLYILNLFAMIEGFKLFNIFIPIILIYYIYYLKIKVNFEQKILIILSIFVFINQASSLFYGADISIVFSFNLRWLVILLILFPMYHLYNKNYALLDNFIIISIFITIISNFYFYFYFYDHMSRFRGTFGNPNEFSLLLTFMTYFILYYKYMYSISLKKNLIMSISLFVLLIGTNLLILITLSRSGIIILLLFYLFYYFHLRKKLNFIYKIILLFTLAGLLLYLFNTFSLEFELLFNRFSNSEGSVSTDTRYEQIIAGMNIIKNNLSSLIFGTGTGSTSDPQWFSEYFLHNSIDKIIRIHNSLISLLVEDGIIGVMVYLLFHIVIGVKIIKLKDSFKFPMLGYLIGGFLYSQMAYIVYYFPYWLGLIIISLHAERLKKKGNQ